MPNTRPPTDKARRFAAQMRLNPSPAEDRLAALLRRTTWKFERDAASSNHVANFLSRRHGVVIMVGDHGRAASHFAGVGFKVLSLADAEVLGDADGVIEQVAELLALHRSRSSKREKKRRQRERKRYLRALDNVDARLDHRDIPRPFASPLVVAAYERLKKAAWKNPKPQQQLIRKKIEPFVPKDLRRKGGLYRPWQPPTEQGPLELPAAIAEACPSPSKS